MIISCWQGCQQELAEDSSADLVRVISLVWVLPLAGYGKLSITKGVLSHESVHPSYGVIISALWMYNMYSANDIPCTALRYIELDQESGLIIFLRVFLTYPFQMFS